MSIDYKQKYRFLKKKLKKLIYENECYQEELKLSQKKLLKVNKEKSYLLDELLQYEGVENSDEDVASSSSDQEVNKVSKRPHNVPTAINKTSKRLSAKKRKVPTPKQQFQIGGNALSESNQLSSQREVERRLDMKSFINLTLPSQRPPDDIFNDDCSDISLVTPSQADEDSNLIIDM